MNIKAQKKLSLALLEWHGGMSSGLYAVGSCMLSDSEKGVAYSVQRHHGHEDAIGWAIKELREMKSRAKFPDAVSAKDERACNALADKLAVFVPPVAEAPASSARFVPSLSEAQERRLGELLVAVLPLRRASGAAGRLPSPNYITSHGAKTALGLARVVVNLVDEALSLEGGHVA